MRVIGTREAGPAQIPHFPSENTHWLQAIALIHYSFLETLCLKIANKVCVHKITGSTIGGNYNQPNQAPAIPHGMPANVLSAEFYMT